MANVNKKIRNATVVKSNKITFKSILEKMCYNTLLGQGFNPQYEPKQITLWDGFIPIQKSIYRKHSKRSSMPKESNIKVINLNNKEEFKKFINVLTGIISGKC